MPPFANICEAAERRAVHALTFLQPVDIRADKRAPRGYAVDMEPRWTPAFPLAQLAPGSARVFKHPDAQVAVFHLADGALHAVDNRCPHEGYPLAVGAVKGCVLTCQWHNFKFDLRDGACVMGEEAVRSYPVRVTDGVVEVDLAPPPGLIAGIWADLEAAMVVQETGRIARGVVRLLTLGVEPARIAAQAAIFDAQRAEYGTTHALPFAAAALIPTPGVEPALPLVQALDLAARSHVRLPRRAAPDPVDPGEDPVEAGTRVRAAVEAEEPLAEALVRGAVAKGWRRAELEPWFLGLCADHFLDFGHALIFTHAAFDLLDGADWHGAADVLGALTWSITCGTREDTLPAWARWRREITDVSSASSTLPPDALIDLDRPAAFAAVAAAGPGAIDALSIAAAERLLRFDPAIDADPTLAEGWLDVTHRLTFVQAVRRALLRAAPADALRLLLQAAWFVAGARPLDGPSSADSVPSTLDEVVAAVAARQPDATARARAFLAAGGDAAALTSALETVAVRDHAVRAIFLVHLVKTLRAGASERRSTGDDRPLLAAVRYLSTPARERNVERSVNDAIALVHHGRPPRALTD